MSRFLRRYFGLGILDREVVLGSESSRATVSQIFTVLFLYFGVLFGVVGAHVLTRLRSSSEGPLVFNGMALLRGLIVATVLFPLVAPKIMNLASGDPNCEGVPAKPIINLLLQFCVAVQNGFFWQAVLL